MKRITTISLLIVAAFGSSAAQAEVVSNAWLGSLSIQLIDLDPNDGIEASLMPTGYDQYIFGYAQDTAAGNFQSYNMPPSGSASTAISHAESAITGTDPSNATHSASGYATGPSASLGYSGEYWGDGYTYGNFILSANTSVIFSADASTIASSNASYSTGYEYAFAQAYLYGYLYHGQNGYYGQDIIQSTGDNDNGTYNPDTGEYEYSNVSDSKAGTLSVTLSNPFAEAVNGYLFGRAIVNGYSYSDYKSPSQVPVPAALPLLASALGLFGFARRKV